MHIPIYYNVISCCNHDLRWFMGIFHQSPLVITLQNTKTIFCVFLCFRNLPKLKLTWDFSGINIILWEPSGAQEVNKGGHEGQTKPGGAGPGPGHATKVRLGLKPLIPSMFVSWRSAWSKNTYIKTPLGVPERRRPWNTKHINRGCSIKDWREKRCWSRPGRFSNLSDINTIDTVIKRE
jgi:hypothetical protein